MIFCNSRGWESEYQGTKYFLSHQSINVTWLTIKLCWFEMTKSDTALMCQRKQIKDVDGHDYQKPQKLNYNE